MHVWEPIYPAPPVTRINAHLQRCFQQAIAQRRLSYGYQWWTYDDGSCAARRIFGQGIFIDPKRKLVIVSSANWAGGARDRTATASREAFYRVVQKAVDDEGRGAPAS